MTLAINNPHNTLGNAQVYEFALKHAFPFCISPQNAWPNSGYYCSLSLGAAFLSRLLAKWDALS